MAIWTLTVRSTYLATQEEVWLQKTDPQALLDEFAPYLRLTIPDPQALMAALRGAAPASFHAKVTGPLGLIGMPWPMRIEESVAPRLYRDTSVNALYKHFQHTHRVLPSGPGRVKYIDEVVFEPRFRPSRLSARITRALFLHRHARAARHLMLDQVDGTRSWLATEGPFARPLRHATAG